MRYLVIAASVFLAASVAKGVVVFSQAPSPSGGLIASSWVDSNGSDADMYAYDNFTLATTESITAISWRGGYIYGGTYGSCFDFYVTFFDSIPGGSQPHVGNPQLEDTNPIYLVKHHVGGTANPTYAGTFGGTPMYDYTYTLPASFVAAAGTKYWVRIEASQPTYPDWGIAVGTGGDGQHFQFSTGAAMFSMVSSDAAFTLYNAAVPVGLSAFSVE